MWGRGALVVAATGLLAGLTACGAGPASPRSTHVSAHRAAVMADPTGAPTARPNTTPTTGGVSLAPLAGGSTPGPTPPVGLFHHPATPDGDPIPRRAWVAVPVLTVWDRPDLVRPVDAPILKTQPLVAPWLAAMNFAQRLDLGQRVATQALLDDSLTVLDAEGDWAHVLVDDQTGSVYPEGIEGWVPRSQISFAPPPDDGAFVTVSVPVAQSGGVQLSYGTRLPYLGSTGGSVEVASAEGTLTLPKGSVHPGLLPASGAAVLEQAKQFLGLPYLWAGTSGYGYDCSGLTYSVYRQFGITLARDAADQSEQGIPVTRDDLRPGDLVFFAAAGVVHHVAIYAGQGMMLDAPETGGRVEIVPLWGSPLSVQYSGARRYIS